MGLTNITCSHDYATLGQITADYYVWMILTREYVILCIKNHGNIGFYGPIFQLNVEKEIGFKFQTSVQNQ